MIELQRGRTAVISEVANKDMHNEGGLSGTESFTKANAAWNCRAMSQQVNPCANVAT
jgi:hypothetical protein